jgi:myo-inositol-1(or 4)-monophosphatase
LQEIETIFLALIEAGKIVKEIYESVFEVQWKSEDDPLTDADLSVNKLLMDVLNKNFPEDSILSEEVKDNDSRLQNKRVWIIDPIDGTREFVKKNPEFGISIGLVSSKRAIFGAVMNPITREIIIGSLEEGLDYLILNEDYTEPRVQFNFKKRIKTELKRKPDLIISKSEHRDGLFNHSYWKDNFNIKPVGSIAYKLALVAAGVSDLTISLKPKNEWDICAGAALVEASGGKVFELSSLKPIKFNSKKPSVGGIIAGNPDLVDDLINKEADKLKSFFYED